MTLQEFVEQKYLPHSKLHKRPNTYYTEAKHFKWVLADFGKCKLSGITADDVLAFQERCKQNGFSDKTINNRVALLRAALRSACIQGLLLKVPYIKLLKINKLPPRCFSEKEMQTILTTAQQNKRLYDTIFIYLHTGMRRAELTNLKWANVDFANRVITVEITKTHIFRSIPINDVLLEHLNRLKKECPEKQVYIFENEDGTPLTGGQIYNPLRRLLNSLGIGVSGSCVHALRHTFASYLVRHGVSIYEVQKLLGHSDIKVTERYAHLFPVDLAKSVNVLSTDGILTGKQENEGQNEKN
jgi:integrase